MLLTKSDLPAAAPYARRLVLAFAAATLVSGCAQTSLDLASLTEPSAETASAPVETGSTSKPAATAQATPESAPVSGPIADARRARAAGDKAKALAILDKAAAAEPRNKSVAKERGLVALELGQVKKAEETLRKAHDPKAPDWRLHSALGSALAAQGRQSDAQIQFSKALEIAPDHPSVLNNLALSYALDGKHDEAERLLKKVAGLKGAEPKVQQNLALILGLKGKIEEAAKVSEAALPGDLAKANVSYLSRLKAREERTQVSRAAPPAADEGVKAATAEPSASDMHTRLLDAN